MDRRLHESVTKGDVSSLKELIKHDENIIKQTVPMSLNTVLHLAARFGHVELAKEVIIRSCPEMVSWENAELETPLHIACREGSLEIVKLLLEVDPWIAFKVNSREESALFAACQQGNIDVVKHLLNFPMLLMLEVDALTSSSIHVAASFGYTEIVKEILKLRPSFSWKKNFKGCTPLHFACAKGHLEITKELLKLNPDLCSVQDDEGLTPLHIAASNGRIDIIDEMVSLSRECARMTTTNGETILHLAVKNDKYDLVKYLIETLNTAKILNLPDVDGNTILHLATAGKLTTMVMYLLKIGVEVNALNGKGYTALDVVESDASNCGALTIVPALIEAGGKRRDQLSHGSVDIQQIKESTLQSLDEGFQRKPILSKTPEYSCRHHCHQRQNGRKEKLDLENEGIRNARKTVTIVAVLIASVTFTAGINPPGGFNQETGKASRGNYMAFKVFLSCNIVALFLSIGVVNILVSIIPFSRKTMMSLLKVAHKVMWVSTLLMTAAYIAAVWTIMPSDKGTRVLLAELVVLGGGCTIVVFFGLWLMWTMHCIEKKNMRSVRRRKVKDENPYCDISRVEELINGHSERCNSNVDSFDEGYNLY